MRRSFSISSVAAIIALFGLSVGCRTPAGVPLEPEQTYVLPDGAVTVEAGAGLRDRPATYPRAVDENPASAVTANIRWGVTDRLTIALPVPLSGSFLIDEGARSQTSAQWNLGGGYGTPVGLIFVWSAGLTELVMLNPNLHLIVQFGGGTFRDREVFEFWGDATIGAVFRLGENLRLTPAVQGYRESPLNAGARFFEPDGSDGIRFGGVTNRGRLSPWSQQPLILYHVIYGLSLFENSTFDIRKGRFYEQTHVVGIRARF